MASAVSSWREERYSGNSSRAEGIASASHSGAQSDPGEAKIFSTPILRRVRRRACAPLIVPALSMSGMFSRTGKHQRFDHHRHGARGREQLADVDKVEFLEDDPVDRHDRVGKAVFFPTVDADQAPDVAVPDQDEGQAAPERARKARDDSPAEGVQPPKRRRAFP